MKYTKICIKRLWNGHLLDSYEGPRSYMQLVTVPQMTPLCDEAFVDWKRRDTFSAEALEQTIKVEEVRQTERNKD